MCVFLHVYAPVYARLQFSADLDLWIWHVDLMFGQNTTTWPPYSLQMVMMGFADGPRDASKHGC